MQPDNFDWLPPLRSPRKQRPKPVAGKYDLRKLYYDARRVMFEREYPAAWAAGEYYDNDFPVIDTTNGTMNYIQDVLNYLGHHAERLNVMGIPQVDSMGRPILDDKGKQKYRKSGSTKGSSDIPCEIKIPSQALPVGWKIEVKRGNDSLNKSQVKYQKKMQRVGVLHSVIYVGGLDEFWEEYNRILKL